MRKGVAADLEYSTFLIESEASELNTLWLAEGCQSNLQRCARSYVEDCHLRIKSTVLPLTWAFASIRAGYIDNLYDVSALV
jgi:hypothetical protein